MGKKWMLVFLSFLGALRIEVCEGGWRTDQVLVVEKESMPSSLVYSDNGTAWMSLRASPDLEVTRFVDGVWMPLQLISSSLNSSRSLLGIDNLGNSFLVYGTTTGILASRYDALSNTWSSPDQLSISSEDRLEDLAMNGDGNGIALFQSGGKLLASRYKRNDSKWDPFELAVQLNSESDTGFIESAKISLDILGNGLAVFFSAESQSVKASFYRAGTESWVNTGDAAVVLSAGVVIGRQFVASSLGGKGLAIWEDEGENIYSSWFNGTDWEHINENAFKLEKGTLAQAKYPIAMDDDGNGFAVWSRTNDGLQELWAARFDGSAKSWGSPVKIYETNNALKNLQVSTDQIGNAFVGWDSSRGNYPYQGFSMTAFYNASLDEWENIFEKAVTLSDRAQISGALILKANRQGKAIAAFSQGEYLGGTFSNFFSPAGPENGSRFIGKSYQDKFLSQIDYVHSLRWESSPDSSVVGYIIRSNGRIISEVDANRPLRLDVHSQKPGVFVSYSLTSVNSSGVESSPLVITLE